MGDLNSEVALYFGKYPRCTQGGLEHLHWVATCMPLPKRKEKKMTTDLPLKDGSARLFLA